MTSHPFLPFYHKSYHKRAVFATFPSIDALWICLSQKVSQMIRLIKGAHPLLCRILPCVGILIMLIISGLALTINNL